jgi:hypothetical protein
MDAIDQAQEYITQHPTETDAEILRRLLLSLSRAEAFDVQLLYGMNLADFDLALEVLKGWRLQRYYRSVALMAVGDAHSH